MLDCLIEGTEQMDIESGGIHHRHVGVKRMHFLDGAFNTILQTARRSRR